MNCGSSQGLSLFDIIQTDRESICESFFHSLHPTRRITRGGGTEFFEMDSEDHMRQTIEQSRGMVVRREEARWMAPGRRRRCKIRSIAVGGSSMAKDQKKIVIVGTFHEKQRISDTPSIFEKKLRNYVGRAGASIIIEEHRFEDDKTIGKRISDELSIAWSNSGPPNLKRFETCDPCRFLLDGDWVTERRYGPIEAQIERESYMIDKICSAMADHAVGIFVCGMAHMHSVSEKLHRTGYDVEGVDCSDD